jgi:hypothetical protein
MVAKRFIHVRGRQWRRRLGVRCPVGVHPRARETMALPLRFPLQEGGSPTCAGGNGLGAFGVSDFLGFTHVRGRQWMSVWQRCVPCLVHPRAREVMGISLSFQAPRLGSPTCAGGNGLSMRLRTPASRFIHVRGRQWMIEASVREVGIGSPTCAGGNGEPASRFRRPRFTHVRGRQWYSSSASLFAALGSPTCSGDNGCAHDCSHRSLGSPTCAGDNGTRLERHRSHERFTHVRGRQWDMKGSPTCAGGYGKIGVAWQSRRSRTRSYAHACMRVTAWRSRRW